MNEQNYDDQKITEYLFGSLSSDETKRFDELSFADEEFAGALAAENELLDRYARGAPAGDALAKFRSHYLASPLRREKVKFAQKQKSPAPLNRSVFFFSLRSRFRSLY